MNSLPTLENLWLQEEAYWALHRYKITYESLIDILWPELDWYNLYTGRWHYLSKTLCQWIANRVTEKLAQQDNQNIAPK